MLACCENCFVTVLHALYHLFSILDKDSTFVPLPDMWFPGFFAFESVSKPSYFVRLNQTEELILDRYDGTTTFKEDASFMLKKRPCASKWIFNLLSKLAKNRKEESFLNWRG